MTSWHDGRKLTIAAASAAAEALDLRPGLPLAEAQARVPGLCVVPADPARDAAALRRIARMCLRYAPLTAAAPPDGVMIDATGCAHLFGGERRMLEAIVADIAERGIEARAAIADTPGAAHALARFGGVLIAISAPGDAGSCLAPLPIEALRIDPQTSQTLRRLGLDTIAAVQHLPRGGLARRLGPLVLLRLDQAVGRVAEPIGYKAADRPITARLEFAEPLLTADAFAVVIARLAHDVAATLAQAGLGARRLELDFERIDGSRHRLQAATGRPVRDPAQLARLLVARLETVDPGLGVEAMRLAIRRAGPFEQLQSDAIASPGSGHPGSNHQAERIFPLIDQLSNRLGADKVWQVAAVESDVPERSVARVPPLSRPPMSRPIWAPAVPTIRPIRLLDPPQPIAVTALLPDHPPAGFVWRRIRHAVRHADGPERIAGEWWRRTGEVRALRDYFRVEDEQGQRFWLFRRGDGADPETGDMSWFLHGFF